MQNQAELAAEAHRGRLVKHTNKCLHSSATAMPVTALRAAAIWGGGVASYDQNPPPKHLGEKSEFAH